MESVVLADDHPLLLRGLCDLLAVENEFDIVGAATEGQEALSAIRLHRPSLAVLDVAMSDMSGLDILRAVRADRIELKVIFLTATITRPQVMDALRLGVNGILLKESAPDALIECMREVSRGRQWLPSDLVADAQQDDSETAILDRLSPRETEVVALVCRGKSNKAIALKLGTTEGTIKVHLHNIYQKLEINNRISLVALNFRAGKNPD